MLGMNLRQYELQMKTEIIQWANNCRIRVVDCLLDIIVGYCRNKFEFCADDILYQNTIEITNDRKNLTYKMEDDCRDITVKLMKSGIWEDMDGIYSLFFKMNKLSFDCIKFGLLSESDTLKFNYVGDIIGGFIDTINQWESSMCFDNITGNTIVGKTWKDYASPRSIKQDDVVEMIINLNVNKISFNIHKSTKKSMDLGTAFSFCQVRQSGKVYPVIMLMNHTDNVSLIHVGHKS